MDKSWISNNSATQKECIRGILNFLDFAFKNSSENGKILCPCTKCVNFKKRSRMDVYEHLISRGFLKGYIRWIFHGEKVSTSNPASASEVQHEFDHDMNTLIHDAFSMHTNSDDNDAYRNMEDVDPETF